MTDDNWIKSAINDTDLVVHVLFKLRQASPPSPPKTWTVRQRRRSRPSPPKKSPATRASPSTPLSWSGAPSGSDGGGGGGGGGGVEESSRPDRRVHDATDGSRSKVIVSNETTSTKRPRKKKTLAELREDEAKLLKERKQLKRQVASLQATCQKQRKDNESLKKMKDDMKPQVLAGSAINGCMEGKKNDSFVLPDLNIPVGEDY